MFFCSSIYATVKKFFLVFFMVLFVNSNSFAAKIESDATVAVMDFGTHPGAVTADINIFNAGKTAHEYILQSIFESNKLNIVDRFMVESTIQSENLNTTGIIDADTARRLGKILGVKYIIYGNVNDVTLSNTGGQIGPGGINICTVKSHIIARIMNVETGEIISAAKGEGVSKSSFVKIHGGVPVILTIGKTKVTQDSVHNALQNAARQTVVILLERLFDSVK